jgi:hypothetical protein
MTASSLIDQLRAIVGAANVLTEGDLSAYEQDWRKRARGKSLAVVRPGSTAAGGRRRQGLRRSRHGRRCRRAATRAWRSAPCRTSPRHAGGAEPAAPEPVRAIDGANLTMTVDAGCVLQNLQQAAETPACCSP